MQYWNGSVTAHSLVLLCAFGVGVVKGAGLQGLGDLPGGSFYSRAYGISADGSIVVGFGNSALGLEAFMWDSANGMMSLEAVLRDADVDTTDWSLRQATGISSDGRYVVGWGTSGNGTEAFLADLSGTPYFSAVPEPSSLVLILAAIGSLARLRSRRRDRD